MAAGGGGITSIVQTGVHELFAAYTTIRLDLARSLLQTSLPDALRIADASDAFSGAVEIYICKCSMSDSGEWCVGERERG